MEYIRSYSLESTRFAASMCFTEEAYVSVLLYVIHVEFIPLKKMLRLTPLYCSRHGYYVDADRGCLIRIHVSARSTRAVPRVRDEVSLQKIRNTGKRSQQKLCNLNQTERATQQTFHLNIEKG